MYFRAVESYIAFEADLAVFLANIRARYDLCSSEGGGLKLATASIDGTLLSTIKEVNMLIQTVLSLFHWERIKCFQKTKKFVWNH